jgi:diguanylate cyclase (GGDEF)-like protein
MYRGRYAPLVTFVSLGASLGLVFLRCAMAGHPFAPRWVITEISSSPGTYAFVALYSLLALSAFAHLLDRKQDLLEVACSDELTGLASRRRFAAQLRDEILRAERTGRPLSLLLIDVDNLKSINDCGGGHEAGDAALREVAHSLRDACRTTDLASRFGGDEFAIIAPGAAGSDAMDLASRIRQSLRASQIARPRRTIPLTVSIGVADLADARCRTAEALCHAADTALYVAKSCGRDRAESSSPPPPCSEELTAIPLAPESGNP